MIGLRSLYAHVRDRFSARRYELKRLNHLPRYAMTTTSLIPPKFEIVDAASFLAMYRAIFDERIYEFTTTADQPLIVDCGANIGVSAVWFQLQYPRSRIIAFEPDPLLFDVLSRNLQRCCLAHKCDLINAAVWNDDSEELMFESEGADAGRVANASTKNQMTVRAERLKKYLREPVDLLKIDIEGAELAVLEDCKDHLHWIRNLFVEYHSFVDQPQRLDELLLLLRESGFRYWLDAEVKRDRPLVNHISYLKMDLQVNIHAARDCPAVDTSSQSESECD
jgi:FkbM family methyltransferase